ncbi:MAG TPA: DUF2306 domain-containing protein [Cytophagales bacterium]|jgi:uncharacterized membrane protein|nr:DUF2306 domain-containing protein [Cytophagales bacterium]
MEWFNEIHIINSKLGLFHLVCSIIALIFGAIIVLNPKGTKKHKFLGYTYVSAMFGLNLSGLGIYNWGSINLFHLFALISLSTIILGLYYVITRHKNWFIYHYYWMSWSVIGLYSALWAEIGTRFFIERYFWWIIIILVILTTFIGSYIINKEAKKLKFK